MILQILIILVCVYVGLHVLWFMLFGAAVAADGFQGWLNAPIKPVV